MDAREDIKSFAESINNLMQVLSQENSLIAARAFNDLGSLQTRKAQFTKAYTKAQNKVQNEPEILNSLTSEERADLKTLYKNFREVLSDNMIALRGAYDATDRVINLIIDAVKEQRGVKSSPAAFGQRPRGYDAYFKPETATIALSTET